MCLNFSFLVDTWHLIGTQYMVGIDIVIIMLITGWDSGGLTVYNLFV